MTPEVRANRYAELIANPLFKEIIETLDATVEIHEGAVYATPNNDSAQGFFEMRSQSIGANIVLKDFKEYLLTTLPQPN